MQSIKSDTSAISAMDLRSPGELLDRVYYRNERFIVKRAGKPQAVIVPLAEFEDMERRRAEAIDRFWELSVPLREAFKEVSEAEIKKEIQQAIKQVRSGKTNK